MLILINIKTGHPISQTGVCLFTLMPNHVFDEISSTQLATSPLAQIGQKAQADLRHATDQGFDF